MTYFATDFENVDSAGEAERFAACLRLQQSLDFYRAYKRRTFELMRLRPGASALEVGCGTGEDALALAWLVGAAGRVTAVDRSRALLAEAIDAAAAEGLAIRFEEADGRSLPFADSGFDAARVDRTLQHIESAERVVAEMARVVRPGGRVVAMEPDWETFTVDAADRLLTRRLLNFWCDSFPSGWIGRQLEGCFAQAGLVDIEAQPETMVIREFDLADRILDLERTARTAVEAGKADPATTESWLRDQYQRDRAGRFFCSFTAFIVSGTKPEFSGE